MSTPVNVLVVGSNGFLGRAVTDRLRKRSSATVYGTHRLSAAFSDSIPFDFWRDDIGPLLEQTEADVVVFVAAVETDAPTTRLVRRAQRFFTACAAQRVIYLSSDAVFDGTKGNYSESDPPSPTTLYGRNLNALEHLVRDTHQNACIIRPSYLYGFSHGELGPRLSGVRRDLFSGETVYYAEDMFKSPMEVNLAAEAVAKLALSDYAGTVHISGARTSVYNFYKDAMTVLDVPVTALYKNRLPADTTVPKDTSLGATLMTQLTNVPVLGVREALARSAG